MLEGIKTSSISRDGAVQTYEMDKISLCAQEELYMYSLYIYNFYMYNFIYI